MTDVVDIEVLRVEPARQGSWPDRVAVEEPLAIQLQGRTIAVVMRTPGHDEELAVGFLRGEGVVRSRAEIASVHHCSERDSDDTVRVLLTSGTPIDFAPLQRNVYASSSCGICGKASIEAALACAAPLTSRVSFDRQVLANAPTILRGVQRLFDESGGVHGAALLSVQGELWAAREDVGRHNAVDKLSGWALLAARELEQSVLVVSGRVSFEIVQKALAARIPAVVAVSAPTSLAVELARRSCMLLAGFVRDGRLNMYAGAERLA
jgi:FdhD protein